MSADEVIARVKELREKLYAYADKAEKSGYVEKAQAFRLAGDEAAKIITN